MDGIKTIGSLMEFINLSDSGSSKDSDDVGEIVEELKRYIDCLIDLAPSLKHPAKDLIQEKKL
jgi:hypothetical protein